MPALSKSAIVAQIFDALPLVDGFKYSTQELQEFLQRSSFKMSTTSKSSPNPNRKVSVYNCYLNANPDIPIQHRREYWDKIKSDTNSDEYQEYQQMADKINSEKNIPSKLSKEDKKALKIQKAKDEKAALQIELQKAKELYNSSTNEVHTEVPTEVPQEVPQEVSSEVSSEVESTPDSEPETISDDDHSDFDKQLQQIKNDEEQQDNERIDEPTDDSGIDSDDDDAQQNSKPEYTGKKPDSSTNNYKEWKKNQMNIPADKSLSRFEYEKGKEEDNFNSKVYDNTLPWFEYITNNMTIIHS